MQRFKSQSQAQLFVATQGAIHNNFNIQLHLTYRKTMRHFRSNSMADWNASSAAGA